VSSLKDAFRVDMPLHAVAAASTIAEMAEWITEHQIEHADAIDLEAALKNMEDMSEEEIRALLDDADADVPG
jgi:hypothetical protein